MSYPKQWVNLPLNRGVVFNNDVPYESVGPDYWTDLDNIIVRGGFVQRVPHSRVAYDTALSVAAPTQLLHGINAEFASTNYWLLFEDDGTAWAIEGTNATQIDNSLLQSVTRPESFSSTLLNGVPVISNGVDEPVFWGGSNLATLTDWTATESCQFIAATQFHLFALDISGPGGTFTSLLKWSDAAEPGTVPDEWTPSASNEAGDVELSDSPGRLLCAHNLRDSLMIYKPSATYQARYVGGNTVFAFRKVLSTSGALNRRSVCDVNGSHLVVTDGDVILTDGTNVRSIAEGRVKRYLFDRINEDNFESLFCTFNRAYNEVIIGIPTNDSPLCSEALVYNVAFDAWGKRRLNDVAHAAVGRVDDNVASTSWGTIGGTWSGFSGTWGSATASLARDSLVFIQADELRQQDVMDEEAVPGVLTKYFMSFGDPTRVKFLKRMHLRVVGNEGLFSIRAAGTMNRDTSFMWKTVNIVAGEGEQVVDITALGRYISFDIFTANVYEFRIVGIELEIEMRGYF